MDKDKADLARAVGETWRMVKGTHFGEQLLNKMAEIDRQAVDLAMGGKAPNSLNEIMEGRGQRKTVTRLRTFFADIEKQEQEAINWQAEQDASRNKG